MIILTILIIIIRKKIAIVIDFIELLSIPLQATPSHSRPFHPTPVYSNPLSETLRLPLMRPDREDDFYTL